MAIIGASSTRNCEFAWLPASFIGTFIVVARVPTAELIVGEEMAMTIYELIDCLHAGHRAYVTAAEIAATISAWLAELGVDSPLAEDLGRAVRAGDRATAHSVADYLSVEVAVAA